MKLSKLFGMYGVVIVLGLVINGAILAGAVWLVVKILQYMGVL